MSYAPYQNLPPAPPPENPPPPPNPPNPPPPPPRPPQLPPPPHPPRPWLRIQKGTHSRRPRVTINSRIRMAMSHPTGIVTSGRLSVAGGGIHVSGLFRWKTDYRADACAMRSTPGDWT